jgi:predicted ATP-dependent protease
LEEDFDELFKVKADFDSYMPRDQEHEEEYAYFIATRCHEENLLHFDRAAVAKVVEYGARLADHQDRLSTRFGALADLVYEANYWANKREADHVTDKDVRRAIEESIYRSNRVETELHELFNDNVMMVSTDGQVAGQVNGLSVFDLGDFSFGQPSRITAQTYMGEAGVVNIEREVNLAGPIHNKGLLTLVGYLGATYAQKQPLSLSASLAFEQNYGGIEGDSASSTELYALLSSLSGLPIHQGRAVTGSVNQKGEIQPIGGATEKIEGFFKLCKARGLTGDQGVLIPAANVRHLMLSEDVLEAVKAGEFNVWAVSTLDEGIELLMGLPAGEQKDDGSYHDNTVHGKVQKRLLSLAVDFKNFGQSDDEEE